MPKFSVIVPVYNGERYLERCLESIVRSIGESRNWEIVCVDDASSDRTAEIVADFARRTDVECRFLRHDENRGSGETRNTGLANAQGEWIAWVDADDAVSSDWAPKIELALDSAKDVDVLCFGARMWRGNAWRPLRYCREVVCLPALTFLRDVVRDIGSSTWMWNKVFRKSLFEGLRFSGRCQEDFRMIPGVLGRSRVAKCVPELLYDYFRPEGSLSRHGDKSGSVDGLKQCLGGLAAVAGAEHLAEVPELAAAWKEGCALRAADYLRNSGYDADFKRFLRGNLWRVLLDSRQYFRAKVKCALMAL